jgi:hypothetical protein
MTLARVTFCALLSLFFASPSLPAAAPQLSAVPGAAPPPPAWTNHGYPLTFLFGNHIDTHQQTMLLPSGNLAGYLYITFTGEFTPEGLPVAKHPDENTPPSEIVPGWILRGKPGSETFVYHDMDHPLWLVGSRADIPQPGGYAHFHWTGAPEHGHELMVQEYPGYFLELTAIRRFAFEHEGQLTPVHPGLDLATHVNIVASFPMSCAGQVSHPAPVAGE